VFKETQIMNLSLKLKTALAVLALAPALSWALVGGEGLLDTPHDFATNGAGTAAGGGTGAGNGISAASTPVGLCTFCHTPHKAQTSQLLWNHTLSANNFSWDATNTTAGTLFPTFAGGTYKGPTAKCLSCHDGSVAIGDIAWFGESSHQGAGNALVPEVMPIGEFLITKVQGGGDLSGNHPVAMPFPANNTASTYNGVTTGAGAILTDWQPNPTLTSNIRLFTDPGTGSISAGVTTGKTGIECSSCHDPHNKQSVDDLFLRGKLVGSTQADGYICLQCHTK